jgi:hypothetical protein
LSHVRSNIIERIVRYVRSLMSLESSESFWGKIIGELVFFRRLGARIENSFVKAARSVAQGLGESQASIEESMGLSSLYMGLLMTALTLIVAVTAYVLH